MEQSTERTLNSSKWHWVGECILFWFNLVIHRKNPGESNKSLQECEMAVISAPSENACCCEPWESRGFAGGIRSPSLQSCSLIGWWEGLLEPTSSARQWGHVTLFTLRLRSWITLWLWMKHGCHPENHKALRVWAEILWSRTWEEKSQLLITDWIHVSTL